MKTIVPSSPASADHLMPVDSVRLVAGDKLTEEAWARWVTGMPAYAGP